MLWTMVGVFLGRDERVRREQATAPPTPQIPVIKVSRNLARDAIKSGVVNTDRVSARVARKGWGGARVTRIVFL